MSYERHDLDEPAPHWPTIRAVGDRIRVVATDPTVRVIIMLALLVLVAHGYPWAPG